MALYHVIRIQRKEKPDEVEERMILPTKRSMESAWRDMRRKHPFAYMIFVQQARSLGCAGVRGTKIVTLHKYTATSLEPGQIGRTANDRRDAALTPALLQAQLSN